MTAEASDNTPDEQVAERASDEGHAAAQDTSEPDRSAEEPDRSEVEIAKELVLDLRAELPRLDARAAAGVALTGALLVSLVTQQSLPMPVFAITVVAAALLTIALLTFLAVLSPRPSASRRYIDDQVDEGRATRRPVDSEVAVARLAAGLAATGRVAYYCSMIVDMSTHVRGKERLLRAAFFADSWRSRAWRSAHRPRCCSGGVETVADQEQGRRRHRCSATPARRAVPDPQAGAIVQAVP